MSVDDLGFKNAIMNMIDKFNRESNVITYYSSINFDDELSIDSNLIISILRIINELNSNAIKYSDGTEIIINVTLKDNNVIIEFKDNGKGGFECLNAHSTMTKSGNEYTITNAAQSQYHFNADGELDWVKDAEGNILTISSMSNNQRIVTDSTGRTYTITYNGNKEHSRINKNRRYHSRTYCHLRIQQ